MKRTFIAVPFELPAGLSALIAELKKRLHDEPIRWSNEANFHVTVKFLGDTPEDQIKPIAEKLALIAPAFTIQHGKVAGIHYFANRGNPSVIYCVPEGLTQLDQLAALVERECTSLGFPAEERTFKAHLTLGRIKYLNYTNRFKDILEDYRNYAIQPLTAEKLVFFESILRPQGPLYKPLGTFLFQGLRDRGTEGLGD